MINVSDEFKREMESRRDFHCRAKIKLAGGGVLGLGDADLTVGGSSYSDGAGASSLPVGEAVSRSAEIEIYNDGDKYADVDFFGAEVSLSLVFALSGSREEEIALGTFTVTEPETCGETVKLSVHDAMWRADTAYVPGIRFPATLGELFRDVCRKCGLPFSTSAFTNSAFVVDAFPEGDYTCRQMLGYIAMFAGGNARVDRTGQCEIISYDFGSGAPAHKLADWITLGADTGDVTVTGVRAEADGASFTCGAPGYVISLENPLFAGHEQEAVDLVGARLVGAVLRRFDGESPAYPLAEFMDAAEVTDRRGRTFRTVLTDIRFAFLGKTELSCSVVSAVRNAGKYISPVSDVVAEARRLVAGERTAREAATAGLAEKIAASGGMYSTEERLPDGSTLLYLHDKPTKGESGNVVRVGSEAVGFSTDGGKSYPYGITVDGDVIARILSAEGVNGDWIDAGTVTASKISSGAVTANKIAAGAVTADKISVSDLAALKAKIGGWSITDTRIEQDHTAEGGYRCGMQCLGYDAPNGAVFFAGCSTPSGGSIVSASKFYVTQNGYLYAQNAHIEGHITATSGSISGSLIVNGTIAAGKIASGAITEDKIAAGAITADKIRAGTITGDKIQGRTLQGYIIGGSYAVGNTITILNNLGLCIVCPGVAYPSVAGACKAWIIGFLSDGGLQALQAYYQSSSNSFTVLSGTSKTLAAWSSTSSGSSNQGGGGSGFSPVPFT